MSAAYRLIASVVFEHAFFADGRLRALHIVPVAACAAMLRKTGVLLRHLDDGVALFGDDNAIERLRLHADDGGGSLGLAFQVFSTDPHFFEYTVPAWPPGQVLFLDTDCAVSSDDGRAMLHAAPCVSDGAFTPRDDARVGAVLGKRTLAPQPAMVVRIALSRSLLADYEANRRFYVRFGSASTRWKYCLFGVEPGQVTIVDLGGDMEFDHYPAVDVADGRRADVFLSKRAVPMREISDRRFQLRSTGTAGDRVLIKRMPNASVGKRFRDVEDGNEILVSEVFINP
jgi:hypothetical protein